MGLTLDAGALIALEPGIRGALDADANAQERVRPVAALPAVAVETLPLHRRASPQEVCSRGITAFHCRRSRAQGAERKGPVSHKRRMYSKRTTVLGGDDCVCASRRSGYGHFAPISIIHSMRTQRLLFALVPAFLVAGCPSSTAHFTPSSTMPLAAHPQGCDFILVTDRPDASFEQIGIVDVTMRGRLVDTAAKFRDIVAPEICRAGGDLVVAIKNRGVYLNGSVYRRRAQ